MTLGESIRIARKAKGYTQKDLAELVGVKFNSISDWEKDKHAPDIDKLERLMDVIDLPLEAAFGIGSAPEKASLLGSLAGDDALLEMIREYKMLRSDKQRAVRNIVHLLND